MSPLKVGCPSCHAALSATPPFLPGMKVKCSQCGVSFPLVEPTAIRPVSVEANRSAPPVAVGVSPPPRPLSRGERPRQPWLAIAAVVGMVLIACGIVVYVLVRRGALENDDALASQGRSGTDAKTSSLANRPEPLTLSTPEVDDSKSQTRIYQRPPDRSSRFEMPTARSSLSAEKQEAVSRAIERGVAYLKRTQKDGGSWTRESHLVGYAALLGLTLLECGVPANDPAVQKAAALVRGERPRTTSTYELGLSVLFLERLGHPADRPIVQELAARLIAGQLPDGGWHYQCPILDPSQQATLLWQLTELRSGAPAKLLKPVAKGTPEPAQKPAKQRERARGKSTRATAVLRNVPSLQEDLRVRQDPASGMADNSNTQFAALALWAAQRQDVPVERALALVAKRFRTCQNDDGGWGYHSGGEQREPSRPSMTCVGLLALAVGHGLGRDDEPARGSVPDEQIQNAMNALGKRVGKPMTRDDYDLYFLWSLERVGVLYGLQRIGGGDWYSWGAEFLVGKQAKGGEWKGSHYHGASPTLDTCFALLFLKRVNLTHDLTTKIEFLKIVPQSEQ